MNTPTLSKQNVQSIEKSIIEVDSRSGRVLGFTSDCFYPNSYLVKVARREIWISAIICLEEGRGNFSKLVNKLHKMGYTVKVPCPLGKMREILEKWKAEKEIQYHDLVGEVEVFTITKEGKNGR